MSPHLESEMLRCIAQAIFEVDNEYMLGCGKISVNRQIRFPAFQVFLA
jgi:hypothetical protein